MPAVRVQARRGQHAQESRERVSRSERNALQYALAVYGLTVLACVRQRRSQRHVVLVRRAWKRHDDADSDQQTEGIMEREQALKILNALANGVHPATGEVFAADSAYQHPDTVRALFEAVRAMEGSRPAAARQPSARPATCLRTRSCAGRRGRRAPRRRLRRGPHLGRAREAAQPLARGDRGAAAQDGQDRRLGADRAAALPARRTRSGRLGALSRSIGLPSAVARRRRYRGKPGFPP